METKWQMTTSTSKFCLRKWHCRNDAYVWRCEPIFNFFHETEHRNIFSASALLDFIKCKIFCRLLAFVLRQRSLDLSWWWFFKWIPRMTIWKLEYPWIKWLTTILILYWWCCLHCEESTACVLWVVTMMDVWAESEGIDLFCLSKGPPLPLVTTEFFSLATAFKHNRHLKYWKSMAYSKDSIIPEE